MRSLRHKLILGYALIGALVVALSLFSLLELRLLERRLVAGGQITAFFDAILEIRRFEKNYFLYHQSPDLNEHRAYLGQAQALLRDQGAAFAALADPDARARLATDLDQYGALMADYARRAPDEALARDIRQLGKTLVIRAETLAGSERQALGSLLERHRHLLLGAVALVTLLVMGIGHRLARRVAKPLRDMETRMEAVAAGHLAKLEMAGGDQEIDALTQAFNHVLRELELRQGQLARAEKLAALGTLLSGVAHELNNPLSNISTSCQILGEEMDSADPAFQRELLDQIDAETWRARRIVGSLLDYARDRAFRAEPLPLASLVEETLRLLRGRVPGQVSIHLDIPGDLAVLGDKQRLQQLLLNLLGNALDALEGPGAIHLRARPAPAAWPAQALVFGQCARPQGALELEVRDTGPGIPGDQLPHIFDPFFTTKAVGQGLGLGLFIAFEIIEEHGGCVAVASEPGGGTRFWIRLPTPGARRGALPDQTPTPAR